MAGPALRIHQNRKRILDIPRVGWVHDAKGREFGGLSSVGVTGTRHLGACSPSGPRRRLTPDAKTSGTSKMHLRQLSHHSKGTRSEVLRRQYVEGFIGWRCKCRDAYSRPPIDRLTLAHREEQAVERLPERPLSVWPLWWRAVEFRCRCWRPIPYMFTGGGLRIAQLGVRGLLLRGATSRRGLHSCASTYITSPCLFTFTLGT